MSRIEELEKRLAADPNSRIFVQLAEEYRKQGLLENAIEICEQGLTKHPLYPSARVALGRALLEAETYDRASEEFEAVLAQIPDNILANKFLGETYHRLGRYQEAIQKYQIAQTLAPEDTELEGKIEAVKAEMAGGGPPPAAPEPADATAPAQPSSAPPSATPPVPPTPMGLSLGAPSAPSPPEPLEPTLVDAGALTADIPAPPAEPDDPAPQEQLRPPDEDLAPIPLVDVDGPMVLEGSPYSNATSEPEPPPLEPVPVVSSTEAFEMTPPLSPLPPPEPPPMESVAPPPPPPVPPQPPAAPPPQPRVDAGPPDEVPVLESAPAQPPVLPRPPVAPAPVEPIVSAPMMPEADAGGDMETPTMAELYASQGHFDKAVSVYRNLLVRDPNETKYLERIEELEMLANATTESLTAAPGGRVESRGEALSDQGTRETIEVLEQWLDGIRRSRGA